MSYSVYILQSSKSNHYYIGSAVDPDERLVKHNAGATPSTKSGRPWEIVYKEYYPSKTDALKREIYLKRMKSSIYLENLIKKNNNSKGATSAGQSVPIKIGKVIPIHRGSRYEIMRQLQVGFAV